MFASSGLSTPPCGVPVVVARTFPSSSTPASKNLRISFSTRRSLMRFATISISFPPPIIPSIHRLSDHLVGIVRRSLGTKPVAASLEIGLEDRLYDDFQRRLHDPISHHRYPKGALPPVRLRDAHPSHRLWPILPFLELSLQLGKERLHPPFLDGLDSLAVSARRTS